MKDQDKSLELDHEYDGIKELNHPLPTWWLITFYGAIIFSVIYFVYYQLGSGKSIAQNYQEHFVENKTLKKNYFKEIGKFDQEMFNSYFSTPEMKSHGEAIFNNNCLSCHSKEGAGLIGPNLTDDYWLLNNGTAQEIYPFIITGNPSAGMPSWGDKLSKDQLYAVAAYIVSLRGKVVENPKAPQGEKYLPDGTMEQ